MGAARWLSLDFSELVARQATNPEPFDVLIIGSGYGGAVAAAELAGCTDNGKPITVCVLERGKEYLPGMFPSRMSELATHLRFSAPGAAAPSRAREGLFDLRFGAHVNVVAANGLGGGSLINAGVMEIPRDEVFSAPRWPAQLRDVAVLKPYFKVAKQRLGAMLGETDNSISDHPHQHSHPLNKHAAFRRLAPDHFQPAALTIAMRDERTEAGVEFKTCKRCGDCATGCNHRAKKSLDTNLLVEAKRRRAEIFCGATVLRIDRDSDDHPWTAYATYTDELLSQRHGGQIGIRAHRIILAAGALGSTEILLRTQQASRTLRFSSMLGRHFSTNGDMIVAGFGQRGEVNAIADEDQAPGARHVGPSITGVIKVEGKTRDGRFKTPLVLEDIGGPGALKFAFEEPFTTARLLHWLGEADMSRHSHGHPKRDPFAVDPSVIARTQVYAAMGDDGANGILRLQPQPEKLLSDGALQIEWPEIGRHQLFEAQVNTLDQLARKAALGGVTVANPMWQLLPGQMQGLLNNQRGPVMTVHPLGGCPMGDSAATGVVNEYGAVFDARGETAYRDLFVMDGAIVPSALGTNPALTIAALALRAIENLKRNFTDLGQQPDALGPRPVFRDVDKNFAEPVPRIATTCEFTERLHGTLTLHQRNGTAARYFAELTLHYEDKPLRELSRADDDGKLSDPVLTLRSPTSDTVAGNVTTSVHPKQSILRLFARDDWQRTEERNCDNEEREVLLDHQACYIAPVSGTLTFMRREPSSAVGRACRALWAWWRNRGARDLWQLLEEFLRNPGAGIAGGGLFRSLLGVWRLATHAGEVRLFEYDLELGTPILESRALNNLPCSKVLGVKRITYARPSNPWRQLMEMTITSFPGLCHKGKRSVLELDNRYMAARGTPLFRIVQQQDQVSALADLAALVAYIARMLLGIHLWSMRLPEAPNPAEPQRLPVALPGLPEPEITEIKVDEERLDEPPPSASPAKIKVISADTGCRTPVHVRLTRYRGKTGAAIPVVMFHGYSASGTTFAHPALDMDIARYLHAAGRDIWIVDLRTSCGLPSATRPWTFEVVALKDIPAAIDHIFRESGEQKVDVIAHCMGAAMFSMAVLAAGTSADSIVTPWDSTAGNPFEDDYKEIREALPGRIRKAVLSQIGPLMVFTPRNIFSSYLTTYLRYYLPVDSYRFRRSAQPQLMEQLMDRVLATLPYPDEDLLIENPAWPPWQRTDFVSTRHRMDALYGRTFNLPNVAPRTLDHIDDFFGPIHPETVTQVIHFVRLRMITNRYGRNPFVSRKNLREHWTFPTLSIHGAESGLSDVATLERMCDLMWDAGRLFTPLRTAGLGHQDVWIGKDAPAKVFANVWNFLKPEPESDPAYVPKPELLAQLPWAGPMLGIPEDGELPCSLSGQPSLGVPLRVALLPVKKATLGTWSPAGGLKDMIVRTPSTGSDWFRVDIPSQLLNNPAAEGVLVLCLYGQSAALGKGSIHMPLGGLGLRSPAAPLRIAPDVSLPLIHAAVEKLLGQQATQPLTAGIVRLRSGPECGDAERIFAVGSCQYPEGLLDGIPAMAAYQRLADRLDGPDPLPQTLILTGDQIYADATAGVFDPAQKDDNLRRAYERWLHKEPVKQVLRRLPVVALPDDHEIYDNWERIHPDYDPQRVKNKLDTLAKGKQHYALYQRNSLPLVGSRLSRALSVQGFPVYLADTRTERAHRTALTVGEAQIMDELAALRDWLIQAPSDLPKLVVSPAVMLPRHRRASTGGTTHSLRSDGWDGYPCSMYALLGHIADKQIRHVVFVSGDEHLGIAARAVLKSKASRADGVVVHSIHTSALYAPYPFANARHDDFIADETFDFASGGAGYTCEVQSSFFPGAGFTLLHFLKENAQWRLRCEFERAPGDAGASVQLVL